jgi:hypothetical protein
VDRVIDATRRGDAEAADAAASELEAIGADAGTADRALRIALGEGGSAVTGPALAALAAALGQTEVLRDAIAPLRAGGAG